MNDFLTLKIFFPIVEKKKNTYFFPKPLPPGKRINYIKEI